MGNSTAWHITFAILIPVVFFFAFTSLLGFLSYVKPAKVVSEVTPEDLGLAYEEVSFSARDGVLLQGWFVPRQDTQPAKTIILLHGWPADKGNILPAMAFLTKEYNLLLFDFRGLGQSQGFYSTIGVQETKDLQAAISYLKSRDITEVGVWGFSMGGAVALMTAPDAPEIRAITSEASYAKLDMLASQAFRMPLVNRPLVFLSVLWAKLFLDVDISKASPVDSARSLDIPILLIHSTDDEVIPFSHAQVLQEALAHNPKAEFWFQQNLSHGQFSKEYQQRILEFFEKNL